MKLIQNSMERNFIVNRHGKIHHVSYLNSDGQTLGLLNRSNWEVTDEDGEELNIYMFKSNSKKEIKKVNENLKLFNKIVNFCKKNFCKYEPEI